MANLTEKVNALCTALQGTGILVIPINERKEPLIKETDLKPLTSEEILNFRPYSLGLQLSKSHYEAVVVHAKNVQGPKTFFELLTRSLLKQRNLDINKLKFYTDNSGEFHIIYRTGLQSLSKSLTKEINDNALIDLISSTGFIEVSDELEVKDIHDIERLSIEEQKELYAVLYSLSLTENFSHTSQYDYNESYTSQNLLTSSEIYTSSVSSLSNELNSDISGDRTSSTLLSNNIYAQDNTVIPTATGEVISSKVTNATYRDPNSSKKNDESTNPRQTKNNNRFRVETLSDVLKRNKNVKPAKMLFGEFWLEGEFCILFGQANTGKSTLTTQIALGLSSGRSENECFSVESEPKKILFFDLEMSERQISRRLQGLQDVGDNILRVDFNPDYLYDGATQESAFDSIKALIEEHKPDAVIFDNLSVIQPNNENAADATYFMSKLNSIKKKYGISILVVAHTPKIYQLKTLEITDLAGSAQNGNLADSVFAIGKTTQKNLRYLKQIKVRENEFTYDTDNVLLMELNNHGNWLHFNPIEQVEEYKQLTLSRSNENRDERDAELYKLYLKGTSIESIEDQFGLKRSRVYDIIKAQKNSSPAEGTE